MPDYDLADGHKAVAMVMLYGDPDNIMQEYYWVQIYLYRADNELAAGLSKENIVITLNKLKKISGEKREADKSPKS